jgi:hypothetical protein
MGYGQADCAEVGLVLIVAALGFKVHPHAPCMSWCDTVNIHAFWYPNQDCCLCQMELICIAYYHAARYLLQCSMLCCRVPKPVPLSKNLQTPSAIQFASSRSLDIDDTFVTIDHVCLWLSFMMRGRGPGTLLINVRPYSCYTCLCARVQG